MCFLGIVFWAMFDQSTQLPFGDRSATWNGLWQTWPVKLVGTVYYILYSYIIYIYILWVFTNLSAVSTCDGTTLRFGVGLFLWESRKNPMGNLWEIDISTVMAIKIGVNSSYSLHE